MALGLRRFAWALCAACVCFATAVQAQPLVRKTLALRDGRSVSLNLPQGFTFSVLADGFKRPRFLARSPDGRLFLTTMYNLADNRRGAVYVLDGFDPRKGTVAKVTPWLSGLRNPNSVAFLKDATGVQWIYLAMTDVLVRYRYTAGELRPTGAAQVVARFPDSGMSAANGGWHLTRTVVAGPDGRIYVSVGSSCNACIEKPAESERRAVVLVMDPDGGNARVLARGVRNAVWMQFQGNRLFASNQGADHLGPDAPNETLYVLKPGMDLGWPHCYVRGAQIKADAKFPRAAGCNGVATPFARFDAHASALGFDYFPAANNAAFGDSWLVALHGSGSLALGHGYKIVRVGADGRALGDVVTGFLKNGKVVGRPGGLMRVGKDAFLFTDTRYGVLYYVHPQ